MSEFDAREKHTCAACGAAAEWSAARQALVCTHCGTLAPAELVQDTGRVREIELVEALRQVPETSRGWLTDTRSVRCRSCQAVSVFERARVAQHCEFCGSPELVDYEEIKAPLRPEGVLPFRLDRTRAGETLRRWIAGRWLAPRGFRRRVRVEGAHGVYLPYWTFDARTRSRWHAESGVFYYTSETARNSRGRLETRRVRHVRWSPASGVLEHVFDDEPVAATRGVDPALLHRVEPFPTREVVPYDTAYLAGFVVEHYQVVLIDAARAAREAMERQLRQLCGRQVPGDTFRNLRVESEFAGQTFKHVLVPVWLQAYRYGSRVYQVIVNGSTGTIAGRYPKSPWKIALLVLAAAAVLAALVYLSK